MVINSGTGGSYVDLIGYAVRVKYTDGSLLFEVGAPGLGFYGHAPGAQPTVAGSKGGNAALTSLMTALAGLGLVVDGTS
jgi:hypothetical protein